MKNQNCFNLEDLNLQEMESMNGGYELPEVVCVGSIADYNIKCETERVTALMDGYSLGVQGLGWLYLGVYGVYQHLVH